MSFFDRVTYLKEEELFSYSLSCFRVQTNIHAICTRRDSVYSNGMLGQLKILLDFPENYLPDTCIISKSMQRFKLESK